MSRGASVRNQAAKPPLTPQNPEQGRRPCESGRHATCTEGACRRDLFLAGKGH